MNEAITIRATLPAWVTSTHSVDRLMRFTKEGKHQLAAEEMFYATGDMDKGSNPWTRVGMADVTVTLQSQDELVSNQLRSLQAELDAARAEWLTKQQAIMERVSKLQAIMERVSKLQAIACEVPA